MKKRSLFGIGFVLIASVSVVFSRSGGGGNGGIERIAKQRGLTPADIEAAVSTYTPSGKPDPYLIFASGGHGGNLLVVGVPSMRIIKTIPVFTPDSWQGYGFGSTESEEVLKGGDYPNGKKIRWGDAHHPALSETNGVYDGQYVFIGDKANARVAVIDLRDFQTKQIVRNPLYVNDHGGTFVTPNTDYIIESSQYNVPLPNRYAQLENYAKDFRGVVTFWKFNRSKGRIEPENSFSIELPAYWQDLSDVGKKVSDGYMFMNSINSEQATGGNMKGKPNLEIGASKNDMDFLHVVNWRKAESLVKAGKAKAIKGMKVLSMQTAIDEKILALVHEPKSPHGVDVTPDGGFLVVSGKLDPHSTVYSFEKIKTAMGQNILEGKDQYGIPILKFDAVLERQVELGLGPLHTQFDKNGYAYTSLFLDSAIVKWTLGGPWHPGDKAWKVVDKVPVQYNIGHLTCAEGDTAEPGDGYCVALNKWTMDRFNNVGPLLPQAFQLVGTSGEKMKVLYDMPIPNAEPHYAQIVRADRLKPLVAYPMGTNPVTMAKSEHFTPGGKERITRNGKTVDIYMTLIRSHITPDIIEVNKGDHVRIFVSSLEAAKDATHGFAISGYGINLSMEPGKVETIDFVADQEGVFPYYCTEFCSALHLEMMGHLLVKGSRSAPREMASKQ